MDRRQFIAASTAFALASGVRLDAAVLGGEDARLKAMMDRYWEEDIDDAPEVATIFGLDTGRRAPSRGRLNDYSPRARARWVASRKGRLAELNRLDAAKLSQPWANNRDVVIYAYTQIAEGGTRFTYGEPTGSYAPFSPYVVSQLSGAYQAVPDFLDSSHPVKTARDAEGYLSRLAAFAGVLDANTAQLKADAARGVLAPDFTLDAALAQMTALRSAAPEASGLAGSLSRRAKAAGIGGDWGARAAKIVGAQVYPALDRQIAALTALRPKATHDAGVWKLPDGDAFYASALAFQTTTTKTPEEVHQLGLAQVADLSGRLDTMLKAQGLAEGAVGARLALLSKRPDQLFPNTDAGRAALLASLNDQVAAIRTKMPTMFRTLPASPVEIVRVPPEIQDGAPNGYATSPTLDGSRPGRFYINLKDTAEWPKFSLPSLTYHEALPGHQWEGSIALAATDTPILRRAGFGFAAYGEGWALYAEQLADEMGMYAGDPLGRIGLLQSLQFRAVRMVVDTGMHAKRWSREKATDYMVETTGLPRGRVQREIDRYCIWPGQACSYKIGHTEWERLRAEAKTRQGDRFDIRAFHDVLRQGSMPLVVLAKVIEQEFPA